MGSRHAFVSDCVVDPGWTPHRHPVLLMARELDLGGSERQLCEMARALDQDRFEVHVGCFRQGGIRAREIHADGIPLVEFPVRSFRSLPNVWSSVQSLRRYMKEHRIRVVHAFDAPSSLFLAVASGALGRAIVLTSQRSFRQTLKPLYRAGLRLSDRVTDGVVVNCDAIRDHLVSDESVPLTNIHLCYNGLDADRFRRWATPCRGLVPPDAVVIGTVCAQRPEKDLATLLKAFAIGSASRPDLFLVLVGDGPQHVGLQRQAHELGVSSRCLFQPTTQDVVPWLSLMDIFVLPSTFEALSNALMEAMACECACVASRTGGNGELIRHNDTGLLFEIGNVRDLAAQVEQLMADSTGRRRLGRRAAAFIGANFSLRAAAERLGAIYDHMLSEQKPA